MSKSSKKPASKKPAGKRPVGRPRKTRPWSEAEDHYLQQFAANFDDAQLATSTGRTEAEVGARLQQLGVDRDAIRERLRKEKSVEHLAIHAGTMGMTGARSASDDAKAPKGGGEEFLKRYGDCIRRG